MDLIAEWSEVVTEMPSMEASVLELPRGSARADLPRPSLVWARLRFPSKEERLEPEAVRERTRRVMLAADTGGTDWELLGETGTDWELLGETGSYWEILGVTGSYWELRGETGRY